MRPAKFIDAVLRRGARHVRALAVAQGLLALILFVGWYLLFGVLLDHAVPLSSPSRFFVLAILVSGCVTVVTRTVVAPVLRTISRLYVAQRIELAYPHFKNSLVTFVQLRKRDAKSRVLPLVAHQAASALQGVDIDAGLDSAKFVRFGYVFVALMICMFTYSFLTPKSVWSSFLRLLRPWADIPAPTSVRIRDVQPGSTKALLGADLEVSAEISGSAPRAVVVKWSRDGDLWQSAPMQLGRQRWHGVLTHLETSLLYRIVAGDASSQTYSVKTLVPPLVEAITVDLAPPAYTGVPRRRQETGSIVAPEGTQAAFTIKANKPLSSVILKLSSGPAVSLEVAGDTATGQLNVSKSGRYAVSLEDQDGLSPSRPVEYDMVAVPDGPPQVAGRGPSEAAPVPPDKPVSFSFDASDDYGISRLVLHFQSDPSNADVKSHVPLAGNSRVNWETQLVPQAMGVRPGDTVSYYVEAFDNREGRPNSARTSIYTFSVAPGRESLMASGESSPASDVPATTANLPGEPEPATGTPESRQAGSPEASAPSPAVEGAAGRDAAAEVRKMIEKDKDIWETIATHYGQPSLDEETGAVSRVAQGQSGEMSQSESEVRPGESRPGEETSSVARPDSEQSRADSISRTGATGTSGQTAIEAATPSGSRPSGVASPATDQAAVSGQTPAADGQTRDSGSSGQVTNAEDAASNKVPGLPSQGQRSRDSQQQAPQADSGPQSQSAQPQGSSGSEASGAPVSAGPTETSGPQASSTGPPGGASGDSSQPGDAAQTAGQSPSGGASAAPSGQDKGPKPGDAPPPGSEQPSPPKAAQGAAEASRSDAPVTASQSPGVSGGARGKRPVTSGASQAGEKPSMDRAGYTESRKDAKVHATRVLVDRLSRDVSSGRVDQSLLVELGWQPSQLRTFVDRYRNLLKGIPEVPFDGDIVLEGSLDSGEVQPGLRTESSVGTLDGRERMINADGGKPPGDIPREEVSPQYRPIVEEYYRSIANTAK